MSETIRILQTGYDSKEFLAIVSAFQKDSGRFPFSQNFRFGGKWNTFRRFVPPENSQKKWKI